MPNNTLVSADRFRELAKAGEVTDTAVAVPCDVEVKSEGEESRDLLFTISTAAIDRYGDTLSVDGWDLDAYRKNPVVLWAHDKSVLPVARSKKTWTEGDRLKAVAEFVPREISPFAEAVFRMYKGEWLKAASVGFMPKKWAWAKDKDRPLGIDFEKQELMEWSAVPVPANPEALMEARAAGADFEPIAEWAATILKAVSSRANISTIREFEDFLRDAGGFSRKEAAAIASHGWSQRDAGEAAIKDALAQARALFRR